MPARLAQIAPFPAVAIRLLSLLSDDDCSFSNIAACVGADAALSSCLIRRANAADLRTYCEANNVMQAVAALGIDRTRELSLAMVTSNFARVAGKPEIRRACWHHTLACALCASEIARQCGLRPAEAYTAALLHDIGRLGLLSAYPTEYEEIVAEAGGQRDKLIDGERERFGVDHSEAGKWLAQRWGLPETIQEVIALHHDKPEKKLDQLGVVQAACRLADLLGFGLTAYEQLPTNDEVLAALPEWASARVFPQLHSLREAIGREIQFIEGIENGAPVANPRPAPEAPQMESMPASLLRTGRSWGISLLLLAATVAAGALAGAIAFWRGR